MSNLKELTVTDLDRFNLEPLVKNESLFINRLPHSKWSSKYIRDMIFISYAHEDKASFNDLERMLRPALKSNLINIWHDQKIKPGLEWRKEISTALKKAGIGVLLVSDNFFASEFINEKELPYLLYAAEERDVKILWVPLNHCLYETTGLAGIQSVIPPDRPLESLRGANRKAELKKICNEIIKSYNEVKNSSFAPLKWGEAVESIGDSVEISSKLRSWIAKISQGV